MKAQAKQFASDFGVSTDEAVEGLYDAISAGIPQENVFSFMETAEKSAIAGVTDTDSAVKLLTATLDASTYRSPMPRAYPMRSSLPCGSA